MENEKSFTPEGGTESMEGQSWVRDATSKEAEKLIMEKNAQIKREPDKWPKGSKYVTGSSKSGSTNEVGIYFYNPTAKKERE